MTLQVKNGSDQLPEKMACLRKNLFSFTRMPNANEGKIKEREESEREQTGNEIQKIISI